MRVIAKSWCVKVLAASRAGFLVRVPRRKGDRTAERGRTVASAPSLGFRASSARTQQESSRVAAMSTCTRSTGGATCAEHGDLPLPLNVASALRMAGLPWPLLDRVVDDHRVSPDALDEVTNGPLVYVRGELRGPQHEFELGEQPRAGDGADAVVHERSHHEVGCAAAAADEHRDEDGSMTTPRHDRRVEPHRPRARGHRPTASSQSACTAGCWPGRTGSSRARRVAASSSWRPRLLAAGGRRPSRCACPRGGLRRHRRRRRVDGRAAPGPQRVAPGAASHGLDRRPRAPARGHGGHGCAGRDLAGGARSGAGLSGRGRRSRRRGVAVALRYAAGSPSRRRRRAGQGRRWRRG